MGILSAPKDCVVIRMYRTGQGDCFLLALPHENGSDIVHVMIDCGRKRGSWQSEYLHGVDLDTIVAHLGDACGHKLDLAIATHEHDDHLNGIIESRFDPFTISNVWLPWTEDPEDELANHMREIEGDTLAELAANRNSLASSRGADDPLVRQLDFLLEEATGIPYSHETIVRIDTSENDSELKGNKKSLKILKDKAREKGPDRVKYLHAGDIQHVPGTNVRVYVLGPPHNQAAINDLEVIPERDGFVETDDCKDATVTDLERPASSQEFDVFSESIELAFKEGGRCNNTSLVLAFELPETNKVLLFAGDAQHGSWLSWANLGWTFGKRAGSRSVTSRDLLNNTVMYKVSHHGSHNATLTGGVGADWPNLDWMATGPAAGEFTAMITAVRSWACGKQKWNHPLPSIEQALSKKATRVFQTDDGCPGDSALCKQIYFDHVVRDSWEK